MINFTYRVTILPLFGWQQRIDKCKSDEANATEIAMKASHVES